MMVYSSAKCNFDYILIAPDNFHISGHAKLRKLRTTRGNTQPTTAAFQWFTQTAALH
jgi:hypothetical protein